MAPAQVVYNASADPQSPEHSLFPGSLFAGIKFFILQRCPTRAAFVNQIRLNGGQVVPLEKQADYVIGDHVRRDSPPGSISYTFIEQSIRDGKLAKPEDHPAGSAERVVREAGSIARPARKGKVPFTAEDDRVLYTWVQECQAKGGRVLGNAIFIQLEELVRGGRFMIFVTSVIWADNGLCAESAAYVAIMAGSICEIPATQTSRFVTTTQWHKEWCRSCARASASARTRGRPAT